MRHFLTEAGNPVNVALRQFDPSTKLRVVSMSNHQLTEGLTDHCAGLSLFRPLIFGRAGCIMVADHRHPAMVS
jgi:hypothetical protein